MVLLLVELGQTSVRWTRRRETVPSLIKTLPHKLFYLKIVCILKLKDCHHHGYKSHMMKIIKLFKTNFSFHNSGGKYGMMSQTINL